MPVNAIANSNVIPIKRAFNKLIKTQFPLKRLIGPQNKYLRDGAFESPNITPSNLNADHICQYIAASIISHCFDGWNFLSRGIEAFLNGDIPTTIHLIYYSELRSVMSIMANNGIGVFNRKHVYFNLSSNAVFIINSTHPAAHELFEAWAASPSHKEKVLKLIKVNSRSLFDWITASSIATSSSFSTLIVKHWLQKWSLDLQLRDDRTIRNESSYRPHFVTNNIDVSENFENLISIWRLLEPNTQNRFNLLDTFLFRLAIESTFENTIGHTIKHRQYVPFVQDIFTNLGESQNQYLFEFTLRRQQPLDPFLLTEAKKDLNKRKINYKDPFPMICRAILLNRLATGFVDDYLVESGINKNLLNFWWEDIAQKLGITSTSPSGITPVDLYTDISDAIEIINSNISNINSVSDCIKNYAPEINSLKQFQRTCFWGLGL